MSDSKELINAAVLVPVYRNGDGRLRVVFIRRSANGVHPNEISFPGGKTEPRDESFLDTALRETHEEIGLPRERIRVLAELEPVETRATGFRIYPFLGAIDPTDWVVDHNEVAEVIDHDLSDLADPAKFGEEVVHYDNWPEPRQISFYRIGDQKLWGASFRIFHPLLPRLIGNEWEI